MGLKTTLPRFLAVTLGIQLTPALAWKPKFDPWVEKIPRRREWQPTPVFFPEEFHGQRSLAGNTVHGIAESDMIEQLILSHSKFDKHVLCVFLLLRASNF